jgi:AcrR family transcriptional regulator
MPTLGPPPRPPDPADPRLATSDRLLAAALLVLEAEGIHALTQTRVAERAGLRQSNLTYYFPTRADLLKAVVEYAAGDGPDIVRGDAAAMPPTLATLKQHLADRVTDVRMARLMLALTTASDEDPSLKRWMVEFDARVRETFAAAFAAMGYAVPAQELALFHATVVGTAVLHSSEATEDSAREARRLVALACDRLIAGAKRA